MTPHLLRPLLAAAPLALLGLLALAVAPSPPAAAERPGITGLVARPGHTVIARAWHGTVPKEKADEYQRYLAGAVKKFRTIPGNLGYQVMRLDGGPEGTRPVAEFQVISYWESLEAIKAYAGDDVRRTRALPRDPEYLLEPEPFVRNYLLQVHDLEP